MESQATVQPALAIGPWHEDKRIILGLWLIAGVILLGCAAGFPLERTQEARVLQTAREMLGQGRHGWMIPHLNGRVRLEKPPLAYWLTASSYKLFGQSVFSGRLPMVLFAWLTVALTYHFCRRLFNARAAIFAAAILLSSLLFCRNGCLAETDLLATFFVTAAIYAIYVAWEREEKSCVPFLQLAAVCMALAILAKGPPGLFPLLFLIALAATTSRWELLSRFLISGACLLMLAIALPWFLYVWRTPEGAIMKTEGAILLKGLDHKAPFWFYFPELLKVTLPYVGFFILALIAAIPQWRTNLAVRAILIWLLVILVPLTLIGQKQEHYLMPLLPALAMLIGYVLDRAITQVDPMLTRSAQFVLLCTILATALAGSAPIIAADKFRHHIFFPDLVLAGLLLGIGIYLFVIHSRRPLVLTTSAMLVAGSLLMPFAFAIWAPTLQTTTRQDIARHIHNQCGDADYVFWGEESLTLSYYLGRPIPTCHNEEQFDEASRRYSNLALIFDTGKKKGSPRPPGVVEVLRVETGDKPVIVYQYLGLYRNLTSPASPATRPSSAPR